MNIYHSSANLRPGKGTATGRVWEIADEMTIRTGQTARRKQVIEAFAAEGGNPNTASTQFSHWRNSPQGAVRAEEAAKRAHNASGQSGPTGSLQLRFDSFGRLAIPVEWREAMKLGESGKVNARLVDGELHLMTPSVALEKARKLLRQHVPEGVSLVDEFITEKRAEAARE